MSCTQNCNQGRQCTCRPTGDAHEWIDEMGHIATVIVAAAACAIAFLSAFALVIWIKRAAGFTLF